MKKIILDSYAVLTWFRKQKHWQEVEELFVKSSKGELNLFISRINLIEVEYQIIRQLGNNSAEEIVSQLSEVLNIQIIEATPEICSEVSKYKAKGNIALPDCFALVTAINLKAELWTGDKEFKQFEQDIKIYWLD